MPGYKYIKRERQNGKWKYTYPDSSKRNIAAKKVKTFAPSASNAGANPKTKTSQRQFKYIKREWKKGKWYYTYPDDLVSKVKNALGFDEKTRMEAAKNEKESSLAVYSMQVATSGSNVQNALSDARTAGVNFVKAREEFMNTPLGKLQTLKDRGAFAVKNLFANKGTANMSANDLSNHLIDVTIDKVRRETDNQITNTSETREFLNQLRKLRANNSLPTLPIKKSPSTLARDEAAVNPNFSPDDPNTSMNCFLCTVAYDLRRRGYDVKARDEASTYDIKKANGLYKGADALHVSIEVPFRNQKDSIPEKEALDLLNRSLLAYGNGARGNLAMYLKIGGGHSVSWEVENNKVMIRDTQSNRAEELLEWKDYYFAYEIFTFRTDNWTPTKEVLKLVEPASK